MEVDPNNKNLLSPRLFEKEGEYELFSKYLINLSLQLHEWTGEGHSGWADTVFGKVRRIRTKNSGFGVKTGRNFKCFKGACVFALNGLIAVSPTEKPEWDGYTFIGARGIDLRPNCLRADVKCFPPMMVNTPSREIGETSNLRLDIYGRNARFVATRAISAEEVLLVAYGRKYSKDLRTERDRIRVEREAQKTSRQNKNHTRTCKCGKSYHPRLHLKHYRQCKLRVQPE